jgi:hypothetical protein
VHFHYLPIFEVLSKGLLVKALLMTFHRIPCFYDVVKAFKALTFLVVRFHVFMCTPGCTLHLTNLNMLVFHDCDVVHGAMLAFPIPHERYTNNENYVASLATANQGRGDYGKAPKSLAFTCETP